MHFYNNVAELRHFRARSAGRSGASSKLHVGTGRLAPCSEIRAVRCRTSESFMATDVPLVANCIAPPPPCIRMSSHSTKMIDAGHSALCEIICAFKIRCTR